jgi:hypothetical protein
MKSTNQPPADRHALCIKTAARLKRRGARDPGRLTTLSSADSSPRSYRILKQEIARSLPHINYRMFSLCSFEPQHAILKQIVTIPVGISENWRNSMTNPFAGVTSPPQCNWQGKSGAWYAHFVYPFRRDLVLRQINYTAVRRDPDGRRYALYTGETEYTPTRFPTHEKFSRAIALGANEFHIHFGGDKHSRLRIETDLRHAHRPPLNEQDVPATRPFGSLSPSIHGLARALGAFGPFDPPQNSLTALLSGAPRPVPANALRSSPFPPFGLAPASGNSLADALLSFDPYRKR